MESPLQLLLLALLTEATKAKVFSQCKLSHMLQKEDTTGLWHRLSAFCSCPGLCMAFYEITFNTAAQSIKANGSANYDVFKISSQLWCTDDHSPLDNGCRVACRDMLSSNITDDIIYCKGRVTNRLRKQKWG
uniref:Uncharacterized protein n=1 Tax=Athene cunicularia TaxID=194338 RepID=A0A663LYQ0_ATHCN